MLWSVLYFPLSICKIIFIWEDLNCQEENHISYVVLLILSNPLPSIIYFQYAK